MKKKIVSLFLALCMMLSFIPSSAFAAGGSGLPFADVETDDWFYEPVSYVYANGLMNGIETNVFAPKKDLTRAMFVTILGRLDGVDVSNYKSISFSDTTSGLWYSPYVEWAADKNIVTGYEDSTFRPSQAITREQMSTIIARYVDYKGITLPSSSNAVSGFNDISDVRTYALDGLELMRTSAIITGDENGNFNPSKTASRAEAATVFMRLDRAIANSDTSTTTDRNDNDTSSTNTKHSTQDSSSGGAGGGSINSGSDSGINLVIDQGDNITVTDVNFQLTGGFSSVYNVVSIEYFIASELDNYEIDDTFDFYTGSAIISGSRWVISDVKPKPKNNIITIVAKTKDGKSYEKKINVYYDIGTSYSRDKNHIKYDEDNDIEYVDNIIIIYFNDYITETKKMQIINEINGVIVAYNNIMDEYTIEISPRSLNELWLICDELEEMYPYDVDGAFVDYVTEIAVNAVPNDPWTDDGLSLSKPSWNLDEWCLLDSTGDYEETTTNWGFKAIDTPTAWEYYNANLISPVLVGVVDTGFDIEHKELEDKIILHFAYEQNNDLKSEHGTHVAGIIGAKGNNRQGIAGVAYNSVMLGINIQNSNDSDPDSIISESLGYAVVVGCKVINYSLGAKLSKGETVNQKIIDDMGKKYSKQMEKLLSCGYDFIVVQAAGNSSVDAINAQYFAAITENNISIPWLSKVKKEDILNRIIIVGNAGIDLNAYINGEKKLKQSSDTNYGEQVDIYAPGGYIYTTHPGGYYIDSGTSMSAPFVSGVCALVWGVDKTWSGAKVQEIVLLNTKDIVYANPDVSEQPDEVHLVNAGLAVEEAIRKKHGDEAIIVVDDDPDDTDDGKINEFIIPITHQKTVPYGYIGIYTVEDLDNIRNYLSGNYILMNDINLTSWGKWEPIGNSNNKFEGIFDGNGYVIRNLVITGEDYEYNGLFGTAYNASISNVGMEDAYINVNSSSGNIYAGGICGYFGSGTSDVTISNCYNTGEVSVYYLGMDSNTDVFAGGICGYTTNPVISCYNIGMATASSDSSGYFAYAFSGGICGYSSYSISNCYNKGSVSSISNGVSKAGGICGQSSGPVENCYNAGAVFSDYCAGGICGNSDVSYHGSSISNCYNTGDVSSEQYAGGICGDVYATNISSCYNKGGIFADYQAGGIYGAIWYRNSNLSNCYCIMLYSNEDDVDFWDNLLELESDQMRDAGSFVGFDFDTTWGIDANINNGYPYLQDLKPND